MTVTTLCMAMLLCVSTESDTLTMERAERRFYANNADLKKARLDSKVKEVGVQQAAAFDNPEVAILYNIYNPINGRWLDNGRDGEMDVNITQPLPIDRGRRIKTAKAELSVANITMNIEVLTLLMQMKGLMGEVVVAQKRLMLLEKEVESVERILAAYQRHPQAISAMERQRLATLRQSLLTEREQRALLLSQNKEYLRQMLALEEDYEVDMLLFKVDYALADTLTEREASNPYIHLCNANISLSQATLKEQQAEQLPKVSLMVEYDKNGNIGHNFWAAGLTCTFPIFNRNQRGVAEAKIGIEKAMLERNMTEVALQQRYRLAVERIERCRHLVAAAEQQKGWDITVIERQYLQHNLSLLEMIDYYNAWREGEELMLTARQEYLNALIEYNLCIGREAIQIK